ncbi:amidase [Alicyclobacillus cycloheptanicus]|uniref:Aspartyl-tRNA(Asn)/glutamyl-tRNA(Gln) amidotransferase subunit A n=1 Tax=Alicyclobacillus cycloheptanicus TaxID=1457 RepID=A0ABT9XKL8_9BACL|nr:amidase [Alicyclobacillus cycloheptanicus]MDQ0190856.1 aspartyl-tRNA(Asn)/glutamyl-tRNA(Gln) amidotransferase subunit A [Alicyclobacillus cycloheptanicus]WDM01448.1 amidase [Alicyclobacillus cycloheptanicus]
MEISVEPYEWTIVETLRALERRICSAEELTRLLLSRIEQANPVLHAFLAVSERAIEDARVIDERRRAGAPVGPLGGVPVAIKDLMDTDFAPTTYGGLHRRDVLPAASAAVVRRLQRAGAIIIGKTNLHEYAYGTTSENPHYGNCVNPWNRAKITGGSSGGSAAAIAAGLCTAAVGTDTGGSIRIPAALTGHVGLKPTHGLVPASGVFPLAPSLDHVGPMTRTVQDAALMLNVMAGYDPRDPHALRAPVPSYESGVLAQPVRIGVPKRFFFDKCQAGVLQTVTEALRRVERDCPAFSFEEVVVPYIEEVPEAQNAVIGSEARAVHADWLRDQPALYGEDVRQRLEAADAIPGYQYVQALEVRRRFRSAVERLLSEVDVLVTPTTPLAATDIGQAKTHIRTLEVTVRSHLTRYTNPWNLSGLPAVTIPCGLTVDQLPVGLQLIGPARAERKLLAVARRFEEVLPWRSIAPDFRT